MTKGAMMYLGLSPVPLRHRAQDAGRRAHLRRGPGPFAMLAAFLRRALGLDALTPRAAPVPVRVRRRAPDNRISPLGM